MDKTRAFVKQVISADTVILRGRPVNGPPPEKLFSFSNVVAPRLNLKEPEKEEEHAFEAREYLRKLIVGREVQYKVYYTTNTNAREYGVILIHPNAAVDGETDVTKIMLKQGLLKAKPGSEQEIMECEQIAKDAQLGIWGSCQKRHAVNLTEDELKGFGQQLKGKEVSGIIEQVKDGSSLRVCILHAGNYYYANWAISGIKAPLCRKDVHNTPDQIEPFGEEAKYFVESKLLQQDVKLIIEGFNANSFFGTVLHPNGNIAEVLLSEGFARILDWNLASVTGGPLKLRQAESKGKSRGIRLWKGYQAPIRPSTSDQQALVIRILNSDLIEVLTPNGQEKRIAFSSIRGIKPKDTNGTYYHAEAKEYLRGRLVGKTVSVKVDYTKPANEGFPETDCATVLFNGKNIGEALVARGLATVIRHKRDDNDRSSCYDQLLLAEEKAKEEKKGIYSSKEVPTVRIVDASENLNKAKGFLPYLVRSGEVAGVVEFCSTGSRFKVLVPSQNCKITLVLSGISVPKTARQQGEKSDPFGEEALTWVNRYVLQRDVKLLVTATDKHGGFIGTLFVEKDKEKLNVAVELLSLGLASIHDYSASESNFAKELYAAEENAKKAKKGLWSVIDPNAFKEDKNTVFTPLQDLALPPIQQCIVSEVLEDGKLCLQIISPDLYKFEKMMEDFAKFHKDFSGPKFVGKQGDYCSAQFTMDDTWYRARIRKLNADKTYNVQYIDFGNMENVPASRLRPLNSMFNLQTLPAQSTEFSLAFVTMPQNDDHHEAVAHLRRISNGKNMGVMILSKEYPNQVILIDPNDKACSTIQMRLVYDGWGLVDKQVAGMYDEHAGKSFRSCLDVVNGMMQAQESARKERRNLWQYGDFENDE